jgi:hypothetical protein
MKKLKLKGISYKRKIRRQMECVFDNDLMENAMSMCY